MSTVIETSSESVILEVVTFTGPPGPAGPTGPTGPSGEGTLGPPGDPGETVEWLSGTTVPANGLGAQDDFYIRTSTGDLYEKTGDSTWTLRMNLRGPTGPAGPSGEDVDSTFVQWVTDGASVAPGYKVGDLVFRYNEALNTIYVDRLTTVPDDWETVASVPIGGGGGPVGNTVLEDLPVYTSLTDIQNDIEDAVLVTGDYIILETV